MIRLRLTFPIAHYVNFLLLKRTVAASTSKGKASRRDDGAVKENLRVAVVLGLDADLELMPLLECHVLDFLQRELMRRNKGGDFDGWMVE